MAYGYGKSNWNFPRKVAAVASEREAQAVRQEARAAAGQNVQVRAPVVASSAEFDQKSQQVVYPAQLNVKFNGQFVGRGWRKQTKYGPCLTLSLEQSVPSGGKLLVVPRRKFPDSLGRT